MILASRFAKNLPHVSHQKLPGFATLDGEPTGFSSSLIASAFVVLDHGSAMSYWCDKQLTVTATRGDEKLEFQLDTPYARIGSHARADVPLPGLPKVAVYLHATSTGVFALPTTLDKSRRPFSPAGWLEEETPYRCGMWNIEVGFKDLSPMVAAVEPLDAPLQPGSSAPVLAVRHQNEPVARHRLRTTLSRIGRTRPSDLRLHTATVSSCHCIAYWDGRHIWVIDLCSTNGTRKDGQRFHAARLRRGRAITLGQIELQFESVDEVPDRATRSSSRSSILLQKPPSPPNLPQAPPGTTDQPSADEFPRSSSVIDRQLERIAAWESRVLECERQSVRQMAEVVRQSAGLSTTRRKVTLLLELFYDYAQTLLQERTCLNERNDELDERMLELERRQNELDAFFASLASQEEKVRAAEAALAEEARVLQQQEEDFLQRRDEQHQVLLKRERELQSQLETLSAKENLVQDLQRKLQVRQDELQIREDLIDQQRQEIELLTVQVRELQEQLGTADQEHSRTLEGKQHEIEQLQKQLLQQQDEIERREDRIAHLQQELQQRSEQLEEIRERFEATSHDRSNAVEEKDRQIEQLHVQLGQQQDEASRRDAIIAEQRQQIQELVEEVGRLRESAQQWQQALRDRELEWGTRIEQWEQEKQEWLKQQREREAETSTQLAERTSEVAQQAAELTKAQQALALAQQELEEQRRQWEHRRAAAEEELEARRSQLNDEIRALRTERAELEAFRLEWESEATAREAEREQWEKAKSEFEKLRRELNEQRQRLQQERARLEALAMEQSEALAAGLASSLATPPDLHPSSDREHNEQPPADPSGHERLIDPQKVIENDPAFDELTERLVEFGRKRKRRWLW